VFECFRSRLRNHPSAANPTFLGSLVTSEIAARHTLDVPMTTAHARAVERVARVCGAYDDARSLRLAVLSEIRRTVSFDAYAWLLTDPETEVGCAPLADVPCLPELPRLIRLKYLTPINRWTRLDLPVGLLRAGTGDQPERSLIWRELLDRYEVNDVASLVFRDRFGCSGFLDLWRIDPGARFTDEEAGFLTGIAESVTEALRRCQARTFDLAASTLNRTGPVVLVLSPELEVRAQTPETEEYLRVLVPPDGDRRPIRPGPITWPRSCSRSRPVWTTIHRPPVCT
jgi:hypothetical protein